MSEPSAIQGSTREYNAQSRPATTEYAEFDFEDASHESDDHNHHQPLLSNIDSSDEDEESMLDSPEQKQYKLPSEGGTIFSSFVNMVSSIIQNLNT